MPHLVLGDEFLEAYARIPKKRQKATREFIRKFEENPRAASIHLEPIHQMRDSKVRTARISKSYRGIVIQAPKGDLFVFAWVDNHDEAMAWARNKQFEVHPETGSLQVFSVVESERVVEESAAQLAPAQRQGLLDRHDDELLTSFGLPPVLLPAVRAIVDRSQIEALAPHLPQECAEALTWLAEGLPIDEIRELVATELPESVDTEDFAQALERPDSKRRFMAPESPEQLDRMLDMPLAKWRVFLHPNQEKLVRRQFNGPAKVTGGAGTGKTVVAMHRASYLAREVFSEASDKILFTTYTVNLAKNLAHNLDELCGDEREQIHSLHLHAWAVRFLRSRGRSYDIATGALLNRYWKQAYTESGVTELELPFIRQEWECVAQPQAVTSKRDYFAASRAGRGRRLSRAQRATIWKVFERFVAAMAHDNYVEWIQVLREARQILEAEGAASLPYRAVVVDEAQDFHEEEWRLIRAMVPPGPNDIFLVGDAQQRIFGRRIVLSRLGIETRGRSRRLTINYRTTEKIRNWSTAMLKGIAIDDLDGSTELDRRYVSLRPGVAPRIELFDTPAEEQTFLVETIQQYLASKPAHEICLVARSGSLLKRHYQPMLERCGIESVVLDQGEPAGDGIRLATMHRVKGLEFPRMLLAAVNADQLPRPCSKDLDEIDRQDHELQERSLLFVAATRARDSLLITSYGDPSPFLC